MEITSISPHDLEGIDQIVTEPCPGCSTVGASWGANQTLTKARQRFGSWVLEIFKAKAATDKPV
jgi:hypothetical protein